MTPPTDRTGGPSLLPSGPNETPPARSICSPGVRPEWARANLAPDRLKRIERLLEVEEGLAFRCPQPRPAPVEVEAKSVPAAPPGKKAGETEADKSAGSEKKTPAKPPV